MTFDHQSFALKVHIVEAFVLGSVGLFAPAALEAFLGPVPPHAAFNMSAVGALSFALALFFAIRPEPLTREHVKKNGSRVALVWNLLRLFVLLPAYLSGSFDNLFIHAVWTSAKLVYVTYAAYGEQLFGHVSLPAFGSDPSESLPAKRTRRAPAKLDADDAAAAADEESYNSATPAPRSKSPGRGARSTPARRAATTPRK